MLTPEQSNWRADKIADLSNLAASVLLFGQLLSKNFDWRPTAIGAVILIAGYYYGNLILKKHRHQYHH